MFLTMQIQLQTHAYTVYVSMYICTYVPIKLFSKAKWFGILHKQFNMIVLLIMQECVGCHQPGATISCSNRGCKASFHYPCAIKAGEYTSIYCTYDINDL